MQLKLEPIGRLGLQQPAEWEAPEASPLMPEAPSVQLLVNADVLLDSLLSEESLSGMSLGLSCHELSDGPLDHFPCIADELEEQAKQLEEDWFCASQPPAAATAAAKAQQSFRLSAAALGPPALRHTALELLQRQLQEEEEQCRHVLRERHQQQQEACGTKQQQQQQEMTAAAGESGREEPSTPQRYSRGDSCWSGTPLPTGSLDDYAEVQSPAPVKFAVLPSPAAPGPSCAAGPSAAGCFLPPLALAIHNAQHVRLGREPIPGAWRGCDRSAWCSLHPRHGSSCDAGALVPGLLAYPPSELFESGVNIEELCRVPQEVLDWAQASMAPDSESDGEAACTGVVAAAADCLSSGKRCRGEGEVEEEGSHSQSGGGGGGTASSGGPAEVAQQQQQQQAIKRLRTDASSACTLAAAFPAMQLAAVVTAVTLQPSPAAVAAAAAEVAAGVCPPRMVPVEVHTPLAIPQFAPPVPLPAPSLGAAFSRNYGRPAGAPRLRPLPRVESLPAPPPAAPVAHTPSKPVTRQKQHSPAGVAPVAPRTSGRRAVMQWHTESVTDPRTGAAVSEVQPGTFCTQCYALSTPVWRAGPFGHKTLCNACGVRWMKASKGSKK